MRSFLFKSKNIKKDSYIWNMLGSMLMAFQSVIMLMILTRTIGLLEAGVFTIAYANANLFLTIGKYGMRNYQVTDVKHQFSFREYKFSRIITLIAMFIVSIIYVIYASLQHQYALEKSLVILVMCLFKMIDAVEDVYIAHYQQNGRLDVGSKIMAIRIAFTMVVFTISLLLIKSLLISLCISTVFTALLLWLFLKMSLGSFKKTKEKRSMAKVLQLLKLCFPLFAGAFLSFYIGNAPKYAIDIQLNDSLQACYGFIAMPVFVIGMLNNFIFNPILHQMSILWNKHDIKRFVKKAIMQIIIITAITFVCIIGAYLIGTPVLSFLYNTDLSQYRSELLILLLGGGFLGLSGFLATMITIMRIQKTLLFGYGIIALLALVLSPWFVQQYEMMGAALIYLVLMFMLCVIFIGISCLKIMVESKA